MRDCLRLVDLQTCLRVKRSSLSSSIWEDPGCGGQYHSLGREPKLFTSEEAKLRESKNEQLGTCFCS